MPCTLIYEHDPSTQATKAKCEGNCEPRYKLENNKFVKVKPVCMYVTPVEFDKVTGAFIPKGKGSQSASEKTQSECVCTLPPIGDPPCKYKPEVDKIKPKKLTAAGCEGSCGKYYEDDQGKTNTLLRCALVLDEQKNVTCVCIIG